MTDREAQTPRMTGTWEIHQARAEALSGHLSARASVEGDPLTSCFFRDLSDGAKTFGRMFNRWGRQPVESAQKLTEIGRFNAFDAYARSIET